jgi:hypothetical protein
VAHNSRCWRSDIFVSGEGEQLGGSRTRVVNGPSYQTKKRQNVRLEFGKQFNHILPPERSLVGESEKTLPVIMIFPNEVHPGRVQPVEKLMHEFHEQGLVVKLKVNKIKQALNKEKQYKPPFS